MIHLIKHIIFIASKNKFNESTVGLGENVDFQYEVNLNYNGSLDMLNSTDDAADMPNRKGPNLRVPKLNPDGSVSPAEGVERISPEAGTNGGNRGFGTKISTNTEGRVVLGRYLSRKDDPDGGSSLGEYIKKDEYSWAKPNE